MESLTLQQSVLTEHWVFNYTVVNLLFSPSESKSIVYKLNEWDWTEGTNVCFWASNDVHILCFHWVSASCSGTTPLLMHLQPSPLQNWVTCYCFLCVHLFICFFNEKNGWINYNHTSKSNWPKSWAHKQSWWFPHVGLMLLPDRTGVSDLYRSKSHSGHRRHKMKFVCSCEKKKNNHNIWKPRKLHKNDYFHIFK